MYDSLNGVGDGVRDGLNGEGDGVRWIKWCR